MRSLRRRAVLAAAASLAAVAAVLTGCAAAPVAAEIEVPAQVEGALPEATVEQLQSAVTAAMGAVGASGAIVGVWAPWSGSWVTGLGTQSFAGGGDVDASMDFRAADVTRAMTCDVLYQVVQAGTVSLDAGVSEYVGGFPDLNDITLRQLCDSTSGLGSYAPQLQSQWFTNPDRRWNPSELASYGLGQGLSGTPGSAYRDSDTGYVLLGLALERATGESMQDLIDELVAGRLGLSATSLPDSAAATPGGDGASLEGHWSMPNADGAMNCAEPTVMTEISASLGASDSGAVTDIADLGRYAQALATNTLTPDTDRFSTPLPVAADQPSWFTATGGAYQAGSLVGQYGSVPGYITAAFADPTTGLTVAVVLNNSGANAQIGAWLAWELAALASKSPAAEGQTLPEAGLPWTAQQFHDQIAANAICAAPAA